MLYLTTRNQSDAVTPAQTMTADRGTCGGFFIPSRMPEFDAQQIAALANRSFAANVAEIINLLFDTNLDSWAVEFAIGRYPVKLKELTGRAVAAETWHNPAWKFERLIRGVEKAMLQSDQVCQTDWMVIAARISVLFGIFGEMLRSGSLNLENPIDVALVCGDFSGVMATVYARAWGLPIANIVVCSNEDPTAWNLLHKGELRTEGIPLRTDIHTVEPVIPKDLERLIFHNLGSYETSRFVKIREQGANYYLERHQAEQLRSGIQVSVLSSSRVEAMISHLYRTNDYISDPDTALCYGGLIEYRSRTGVVRPALILSEVSPVHHADQISLCLGISPSELKNRIDKG